MLVRGLALRPLGAGGLSRSRFARDKLAICGTASAPPAAADTATRSSSGVSSLRACSLSEMLVRLRAWIDPSHLITYSQQRVHQGFNHCNVTSQDAQNLEQIGVVPVRAMMNGFNS